MVFPRPFLEYTEHEVYSFLPVNDLSINMNVHQQIEYGEVKEGYWTSERFMEQIKEAVNKIVEVKYSKDEGRKVVWVFVHSSCYAAMPNDALDVSKMNVNPEGKQRVMQDGLWDGKVQKMNYLLGIPNGLCAVLEERGIDTR